MSEYELISLLREHVAFMMSTLQWWVGITLGILVAVQVLSTKLNGYIASMLMLLYSSFTLMVTQLETRHAERIKFVERDLKVLQNEGPQVSETTQLILSGGGPSEFTLALGAICFWGFFISTITYIIYCYRNNKREK